MPPSHQPQPAQVVFTVAIKRSSEPSGGGIDYIGGSSRGGPSRADVGAGSGMGGGGPWLTPTIKIPVGIRIPPIYVPRISIPTLVPGSARDVAIQIFGPPPARIPAPLPPPVPPVFTQEPISAPSAPILPQTNEVTPVSHDLGHLFRTITEGYAVKALGLTTPGATPVFTGPVQTGTPVLTTPIPPPILSGGGMTIPAPPDNCHSYVWKPPTANCAGRWIRRSRRRRRKLVTNSDIAGLSALKTVGGPSLQKSWIATHHQ